MRRRKGKVTRFYRARTFSKPEAIEARKSLSLSSIPPEDPDLEATEDCDRLATAEPLPPPIDAPDKLSQRTVAIIAALALAILYLIIMLVIASTSPLML